MEFSKRLSGIGGSFTGFDLLVPSEQQPRQLAWGSVYSQPFERAGGVRVYRVQGFKAWGSIFRHIGAYPPTPASGLENHHQQVHKYLGLHIACELHRKRYDLPISQQWPCILRLQSQSV